MDIEDEIYREIDNRDRKIADLEAKEEEAKAREEEAKAREEEAKAREEEERRQKEEAKANLKKMIQKLLHKGFSLNEIAEDLEKSVAEINQIIK